jgi:hypothetical protein
MMIHSRTFILQHVQKPCDILVLYYFGLLGEIIHLDTRILIFQINDDPEVHR